MSALECEREPCPLHGRLCAFHGDESGRCLWCHSSWPVILGSTAKHSCEVPRFWPGDEARWRVAEARRMREKAAENSQNVDTGALCSHMGEKSTEDVAPVSRRSTASAGTAGTAYVECHGCPRRFGVTVETVAFATCPLYGSQASVLGVPEDYGRRWNGEAVADNLRSLLNG